MDNLTKQQRSQQMRLVRASNTGPELAVRRIVHRLGVRYGLHSRDLPGHPDIVLRVRKKVIFVHGCFWHRHTCAAGVRTPKTRVEFWTSKFDRNVARDKSVRAQLRKLGWRTYIVWECQLSAEVKLRSRIKKFLDARD